MRILKMITYLETAHIRFKVNTFYVRIITFLVFVIIKEISLHDITNFFRHTLYTILENMIY